MNYIVTHYKGEADFDKIVTLAKIASIVSITNSCPRSGASAVKHLGSAVARGTIFSMHPLYIFLNALL